MILKKKRNYYIVYSLLFALMFFSCFLIYLLIYHKSVLRIWDTYDQHYLEFIYLGRWVRDGVRTGQFPIWDPSIGYGADMFTTMYGFILDPVNWIAIFVPEGLLSETAFLVMVIIKFYLCGLSFSIFGLRRKKEPFAVLCGAIIYTFCACGYVGMYQSAFMTPMYLFPLLICGTDELFEHKKAGLYTVVLALTAVQNFYFAYMMAILIVIYCLLKWFFSYTGEKTFKIFIQIVGRFVLYSVWAACMAALILLPVAMILTNMGRMDLKRYMPLFYDQGFYANMFKGLVATYDMQGRDCKIGFATLALVGIFTFFITKRKHTQQKIEFILMAVGLCLPIVGRIMNGFGYVANRWIWAFAFLIAYMMTLVLPQIQKMKWWQSLLLIACGGAYVGLAYGVFAAGGDAFMVYSIVLMSLCVLTFLFRFVPAKIYQAVMILISCVTVAVPAYYEYSANYGNAFSLCVDAGGAYTLATNQGGLPLLKDIDTSDGTRYNSADLAITRNASWLYGVSGTDFYMNMYNNHIDEFHNSIALNTYAWPFGYNGLNSRSEILALMGVNHYIKPDHYRYLPVGYDEVETSKTVLNNPLSSWKPDVDYSLFTIFDTGISRDQYDTLLPLDRQQAMMKACVVDSEHANGDLKDLELDESTVPYSVETVEEGIVKEGNTFHVSRPGACVVLRFDAIENAEIYVYFDNIEYENGLATGYTIYARALNGDADTVYVNGYSGTTYVHHMHGGKTHWMLNLGYCEGIADGVRIEFRDAGTYTMDDLVIGSRPLDSIYDNIFFLNHDISRLSFGTDTVSLTANMEEDGYLFAAIPYSEGWQAYDNGKQIDVLNADVGFMALQLNAGEHDIQFRYKTPYFRAGLLISILSIIAFIADRIWKKKKKGAIAK